VKPSTFRVRIEERASLANLVVSEQSLSGLETYYSLLERWNQRINLTALPLANSPIATIDRLIVEPLIASTILENVSGKWLDVGSGGGSPATPLKIVRSDLDLTFVESNQRKAAFLAEVIRTVPLPSARVVAERFEALSVDGNGSADLVTMRAVRPDTALLDVIHRMLRPGAMALLFRSSSQARPEAFDAGGSFENLGDLPLYPSRGVLTKLLNL
jgi:16S rRNA (guanine527-N7)-methyltransferase